MISRELNRDSEHYSDIDQFRREYAIAGEQVSFHEYVKAQVQDDGPLIRPLQGLELRLDRICQRLDARGWQVDAAQQEGWTVAPQDGKTPRKVFWGTTPWHQRNTAAADIRLRADVAELAIFVREVLDLSHTNSARLAFAGSTGYLEAALVAEFERVASRPECRPVYVNSQGEHVQLELRDVLARMEQISFDPYHCPERRWGAAPDSIELSACVEDEPRTVSYARQKSLRRLVRMHQRAPAPERNSLSSEAGRRAYLVLGM